ncbi:MULTISPECIES: hypothetical protein [Cyanophyceae]|uniref:hypothetical protein n=1 Tax=Cyanophyceae TaxID=3028117 RepID=UPI00016DCCF6|nr:MULTISPECIES: hypothetical protein [Cyanophyceae]ACB00709.1 conserved hypothetical membrane protein [Picosynechococcus sp. PCC 7002]SMH51489.1 hypothetical protein SAMN06272755_2351 [Picosynechococcus sp. OG1]SMQ82083.1 hypothetical protein SAMN06272774_1626 [Synechococcus sp. 7002]
MTPTLLGRWQTRLLLMGTVGALLTVCFAEGLWGNPVGAVYWAVWGYITVFGLGWDCLYIYLQNYRWDQDWPAILQWLAALWEGIFFLFLWAGLPNFAGVALPLTADLSLTWFVIHYSSVWLGIFVVSQSLMRILFPLWRFHGGRWF